MTATEFKAKCLAVLYEVQASGEPAARFPVYCRHAQRRRSSALQGAA
jgi:hypothetical protein